MSDIEKIGAIVNSRRYARDLIECSGTLQTRPWWDGVLNTWDTESQNDLIRARQAARQSDEDPFIHFSLKGMFK